MCDATRNIRQQHFASNWLTWAALHHFLPASLMRELSCVIVEKISNSSLNFDDLFADVVSDDTSHMGSWLLQPRQIDSRLGNYLQHRIRGFVWQNDPDSISYKEDNNDTADDVSGPAALDKAIRLGCEDLSPADHLLGDIPSTTQTSFERFAEALKTTREAMILTDDDQFLARIEPIIENIEMPLAAVVVKHLGDLCADGDAWQKAIVLYNQASRQLKETIDPAWNEYTSSLQSIIFQSIAAAIRTLSGTMEAAKLLADHLQTEMLGAPLLVANGSHDAMVAAIQSEFKQGIMPDRRAASLLPPLLHKSHNISDALKLWQNSKYNDAHKKFWATLRRQIALGSATESRTTKSFYARSIFDHLIKTTINQNHSKWFELGIKLLLESGSSDSASQISWNDEVVEMYVDKECVKVAIEHAEAHRGSKLERQFVLIELFTQWCEQVSPEHFDIAAMMLIYIAKLAVHPSTFSSTQNIGGGSLEVLKRVAQKRPEFRQTNNLEVADVVSEKLRMPGFWTGRRDALETALAYADTFSSECLQRVVNSTLTVLDEANPNSVMWPVVRPAMNLLTSPPVKDLAGAFPDLGQRIVSTILHFGLNQESEHTYVMFNLHNFDPTLLRNNSIRTTLQSAVADVRHRATAINSSNAVANIQALLFAPAISGIDGVTDAIHGLTLILGSATERRPSISLPYAYDPLLLLVDQHQEIADHISIDMEKFRSWLQPLVPLIVNLWRKASENPDIFTPFSFSSPNKPDAILVHNWALASCKFIEWIGEEENFETAIASAATNPFLSNGIALAYATLSAEEGRKIDLVALRKEGRDEFYSALGRRLVVLQNLNPEEGCELCKAMIAQCLRLGPRELDAAVFVSALRLELKGAVSIIDCSDYVKRLQNSRELGLSLIPILHMFGYSDEG